MISESADDGAVEFVLALLITSNICLNKFHLLIIALVL